MNFIFNVIFSVLVVYWCRALIALSWNRELADLAIKEIRESVSLKELDVAGEWYMNWSVINSILNPNHFDKWTSKQWYSYLKKS